MEATVEFSLDGTLCRVLPDDQARTPYALAQGESAAPFPEERVVGKCQLDGRRYVIVCGREAARKWLDAEPRAADILTARELQVALMVSQGLANKQIAHRLGLSEWTVTSYLRRSFAKLKVRTRAAMVARIVADLNVDA
ncbi:MAG: helix-turn-helix domain-containing protein [Bdellovibrio bacteriovorus]